jgi:L-2-hydroxyglutarate oxidase
MHLPKFDIAIIGGGIVGIATAAALASKQEVSLVVLEAEHQLASHQTGNNSGVIHSGLYYKPGSIKANNCCAGREALYRFCSQENISFEQCGKIVVAVSEKQIPTLLELERRGCANGLKHIKRLNHKEIRQYEPAASGIAGLFVPDTGIVDYRKVTEKLSDQVLRQGGVIQTGARFFGFRRQANRLLLETTKGMISCRFLINCAGLYSDRVARLCGVDPGVKIIPFRGEYYELLPKSRYLVRNLIYPVPEPELPFLGVHFTRMINGGIEAGPNAVFAFKREGYSKTSFSFKDVFETVTFGGFWKMAGKYWKTGLGEYYRSLSKKAFVDALQKLVPDITTDDVRAKKAGVRAQALDKAGRLIDDFMIIKRQQSIHVLNAPSPAATSSLIIGKQIAHMAQCYFNTK